MKHHTIYRICLLAAILLTLIGGIFYYVNYVERQSTVTEGTLVKRQGQEAGRGAGRQPGGSRLPQAA